MERFRYRAVDARGRIVRGEIEAANPVDLETRLRRLDLDLIHGRPSRQRPLPWRQDIPRRELIHFCFQLEQFLRAGMPIIESLADLRTSTDHPRFRDALAALIEGIEGGLSLSEAMARQPRVFDGVFCGLIRAGELAGQIPTVLRALADALKRDDELAAFARRIVIYPAIVSTVILAALAVALLYVVPELARLFQSTGQPLPLQTRILVGLSRLLIDHGGLLLGLILSGIAGARFALHARPDIREWFDRARLTLPILGELQRKIILARFTILFAMMYASGITIVEALRTAESVVGNTAMKAGLRQIGTSIAEGNRVSDAFLAAPLFPPLVSRMLRVGESTGALDTALANVGYFYDRDVREAIARIEASVEPALTVLMGALLLWVMSAVMLPIYDVATQMKF